MLLGGVERGVVQHELVDARAAIQEKIDGPQVAHLGGGEERRPSVGQAAVHVRAAGDEQLDDAGAGRGSERSPERARAVLEVPVGRSAGVEEGADGAEIAALDGGDEGEGGVVLAVVPRPVDALRGEGLPSGRSSIERPQGAPWALPAPSSAARARVIRLIPCFLPRRPI